MGQAAIMKKIKNREGMIIKHCINQPMATMVINGKLDWLVQSRSVTLFPI